MENPLIKGVIFDLDGVLVDTAKYHLLSWIKISEYLGFELDPSLSEQLKGIGRRESLDIILDHEGIHKTEAEKKALTQLKNDWFLENVEKLGQAIVLPGVLEFINELSQLGIAKGVGSASRNAVYLLQKLNMSQHFVSIIDGNTVLRSKPNPEVFINVARDMQLPENQCLIFEDSQKGIRAGKTGGFTVIGVGDDEILTEADLVIKGFTSISFGELLTNLHKN